MTEEEMQYIIQHDEERRIETGQIIEVLGRNYFAIYALDLETELIRSVKCPDDMREFFLPKPYSEYLQKLIHEYIFPVDRKKAEQFFQIDRLRRCLEEGRIHEEKIEFRRWESNDYKWMSVQLLAVRLKDGTFKIIITKYNVEREKQKTLQQQQLLQDALDMAEKANQAKGDFLSQMSHEIRTPMNVILGMNNIALHSLEDMDKVKECLQKIEISSKHLMELINEVLDMSRIESGRLTLNEMPFSMTELLENVQTMMSAEADKKKLNYRMEREETPYEYLIGDPLRIQQVLINVVSNAIKYTSEGGNVVFTVSQKKDPHTQNVQLCFEVKDTGRGMSKEFLAHLYEPFEREERLEETKVEGSGLGMSITKNIVMMMNGYIHAKSELNVGTEISFGVWVRLDEEKRRVETAKEEFSFETFAGIHVLLVEDNELNQEVAKVILQRMGIEITLAENGLKAVELFEASKEQEYDIIFMDIHMPYLNGYEATKRIRALARKDAEEVPILAMTADAYSEDVTKAYESGMDGHISKPIDIRVLQSTLKKILRK